MSAQTRTLPADVERILAARRGKIREKFAHLDTHQEPAPVPDLLIRGILQDFDEATMSASFVISTQDMDRSGEVVETAGIRTESHRLNPVALWDHGRGPIGRLPIGKCEGPDGTYTVALRQQEGIAVARIFFSQTLPFARDVFRLITEGIIRGASIGFRTIYAEPMPGYSVNDEDPPLHYEEVELCEISPTAVPDNPRALAIKVTKAFEGRRPSSEMLQTLEAKGIQIEDKSMTQTAANKPKPKVLGKAFLADLKSLNEPGLAALSKALSQITGKAADDYLQMDEDGKLNDDSAADTNKDGMNGGSIADGGAAVDTVKDDAGDDTPSYKQPLDGPPGQAAATDLHTQLGGIAETIEGWMARQDNDRIKEVLDNLAQTIDQAMAEIESFHDGEYPDHDTLGAAPGDDGSAGENGNAGSPDANGDGNDTQKSVRRLKPKSPARQRLEKRIKAFRAKSASIGKPRLARQLSKTAADAIVRAAGFLEKALSHAGEWTDVEKAASGFHGKTLRQLAQGASAATDAVDGLDAKAWKEKAEKAQREADEARKIAEKAVDQAEEVTKEWRRYKAGK